MLAFQRNFKLWFPTILLISFSSGTFASVFDLTLHYREFNLDALNKEINQEAHIFVENYANSAKDKLRLIFGDDELDFKVYDIIESGDPSKTPLITFKALLSSSALDDRENFINIWESQDTSDFLLFSVGISSSNEESRDSNGLENFILKYTPKAQGECLNGGFMLPNNTCVCPPYFNTAPDCSQMTCLNSGIQSTSFRCSCPPGYIGRYCEQMGCMAAFESEFDFSKRSFVIVLNIIRDAAFMINNVQQAVVNLVGDRMGYYNNFIVSTYYMNSQLSNYFSYTTMTTNFTIFQQQINNVYANKDGQNKTQPTLAAINQALTTQSSITPKSDVYVFTLFPPSDYDPKDPYTETSNTAESILTRTVISWGHSIYSIVGKSARAPFNDTSVELNAYKNIAAISNGEFINVGTKTSDAAKVFQNLFALNYYPETIASQRNFDCTTAVSVSATIGHYDTGIFIYTTGAGISVTYNGAALIANASYGDFQIFKGAINDTTAAITIKGASKCSYRIFTSSLDSVVPGFAASLMVDVSKAYPSASIPVFPVARIISSSPPPTLHYTAISQMDGSVIADAGDATITTRADCNFPFQFTSWNCSERTFFSKLTYTEDSGLTTRLIPSVCFIPQYRDPIDGPLACNGGTTITFNNTCACPQFQSGKNCEIYNCQNGGTVNPFPMSGGSKCICMDGFTGAFCENLSCSSMSPRPDTSKKTLNFVIQTTNSQSDISLQIQQAANKLASNSEHPGYYYNFVVTSFANLTYSDPFIRTQIFTNSSKFVSAIDGLQGGSSGNGQNQQVFAALISSLNASVMHPWRQTFFLFVDAEPGDAELADQVIASAINLATSINIIVTKPFNLNGDDSVSCMTDTTVYENLVSMTGGIFVNLCNQLDDVSVQNFVSKLGPIHYNLEMVSRQEINCFSPTTSVSIEQNDGIPIRFIFLTFNGDFNFTATLTPPTGPTQTLSFDTKAPGLIIYKANMASIRGNYTLTIAPSGSIPSPEKCNLVVGEQTGQTILAGFAQTPSMDYSSLAAQFGVPAYPTLFMSTQLQSPPTVTISFTSGGMTYTSTAVTRNSSACQFDYFFNNPFGCPTAGETFTINARFTTDDGISFNRAIQSVCQAPAPGTCLNGGYANPGELCTCAPGFMGMFCATPICYNGGSLVSGICKCPSNIGGSHCEYIQCKDWDYLSTFGNNFVAYETVAFVINTKVSSFSINVFLSQYITSFMNGVHSNSQAKQFILVTFDDTNVRKIISTTNQIQFTKVFQAIVPQFPNVTGSSPDGKGLVIEALTEATRLITYKPAMIYLFTSGDILKPDGFVPLNKILGKGGIQINTILQNAQTTLPSSGGNWFYYKQIAIASAGRNIIITDMSNYQNLMETALPNIVYEGVIVEDRTYANCATPQITFFPVEYRSAWFSIFIAGDKANAQSSFVQIWDASNTLINNPSDYLTLTDSGAMWYHFPSTATQNYAGYWKIQVETSSSKACQIQIRASTPLQTSIGFTTDQNSDYPNVQPGTVGVTNATRYITASVSNNLYQQSDAFLEYIKVFSVDSDSGALTLLEGSALAPRDPSGCAFQTISPQISIPIRQSSVQTTAIQIQVNGQDEKGNNFQQIHWYMPQKTECKNSATIDSYGLCVCPASFAGDECDIPICQNGGTADVVVCQCASGYYGDFCENALLSPGTSTTTSATSPTGTTTTAPPAIVRFDGVPFNHSLPVAWENGAKLNATLNALRPGDEFIIPANNTYYLVGGIITKNISDVILHFDGTIIFTNNTDTWPRTLDEKVLECLYFENIRNVTFTSSSVGLIDGQGEAWWGVLGYAIFLENRPRILTIAGSSNILIENLYFKDSPYWTVWIHEVDGLEIRNSEISARRNDYDGHDFFNLAAFNTDGFDVTGKNVWIHDCTIWNQDDCIAVKDGSENMLFERINASGLGLVIGSIGGSTVRNITFRDSYLHKTYKGIYTKFRGPGLIRDVLYENIVMFEPEQWPIWIGPAQQADDVDICKASPCSLCWPEFPTAECNMPSDAQYINIVLRNITVINPTNSTGVIMGSATNPIQNLTFDNVVFETAQENYFVCENVVNGIAIGSTTPVPSCFNTL